MFIQWVLHIFLFLRLFTTDEIYNFQILLTIVFGALIFRNNTGSLVHYYLNTIFHFASPAPLLSLPQAVYLIASSSACILHICGSITLWRLPKQRLGFDVLRLTAFILGNLQGLESLCVSLWLWVWLWMRLCQGKVWCCPEFTYMSTVLDNIVPSRHMEVMSAISITTIHNLLNITLVFACMHRLVFQWLSAPEGISKDNQQPMLG